MNVDVLHLVINNLIKLTHKRIVVFYLLKERKKILLTDFCNPHEYLKGTKILVMNFCTALTGLQHVQL